MGKVKPARGNLRRVRKDAGKPSGSASPSVELSAKQAQRLLDHPERKTVGRGGYGWVSKLPFRGRQCAMKTGFKKKDETGETGIQMLRKEIDLTRNSNGPRVIKVVAYHYGSEKHGTPPVLLLEWCERGDLWTSRKALPKRHNVLQRLEEMLQGLVGIHAAGVCHFDMKPENLLLGDDGTVRIADFGLAMPTAEARKVIGSETVGSPGFEAPECHLKTWEEKRLGRHCTKIDVFAAGMTSAALLAWAGKSIPDHEVLVDATQKLEEEPHLLDLRTDLVTSNKALRRFFLRTCARDPAKRCTPQEALRLLRKVHL